jgi:hypothetical protein
MDLSWVSPNLTDTGTGLILDQDERGTLSVFYSVMDKGASLVLKGADAARGELELIDSVCFLQCRIGSQWRRIDDLIVGARR